MYSWLWMVIISGILLGFWDITKKKALQKNGTLEVLALYTIFCFLFVSFEFKNAMSLSPDKILVLFIKSVVVFFSWIFNFTAIKNLPISVITPFTTLTPLFTILFGITILNERILLTQALGIAVMLISYYFIGKAGSNEMNHFFKNKYLYLMACGALLSATSAIIDKIALKTINSGQMQFWFAFFMAVLYCGALLVTNLRAKKTFSLKFDYLIPLMSILLLVADRIYFNAVNIPSSEISIIIPLRTVSIFVSAIVGGLLFKEKNLKQKFWCICLLIVGIALVFMGS